MSSAGSSTPLNLEADLPTRPEDIVALRRARQNRALSLEEYLDFLGQLESPPPAIRRARRNSRNDAPFEL